MAEIYSFAAQTSAWKKKTAAQQSLAAWFQKGLKPLSFVASLVGWILMAP